LSGGGTLGPVTPLLALVEYWRARERKAEYVWVGTAKGPEAEVVAGSGIRFIAMQSVKAPRYITAYWVLVPFLFVYSFVQARRILRDERPDIIVSAGGYVSVPLVLLGRLRGIPSLIHQQDIIPGLANKIMSWFAKAVSVVFSSSQSAFPRKKTKVLGNPVRESVIYGNAKLAAERFGLDADRKTILVLGGGTGSAWLNRTVEALGDTLTREWQVLHITGRGGRGSEVMPRKHYAVEALVADAMGDIYELADAVVCRAGLGTLTEIAATGKPAIVIPIPESHQEMNAFFLFEHKAAIVLDQNETTPQVLLSAIQSVMRQDDLVLRLSANLRQAFPKDGTKEIADWVWALGEAAEGKWRREEEGINESWNQGIEEFEGDKTDIPVAKEEEAMISIQDQIARALEEGRKDDGVEEESG
ncbi:MAG: UDP-N-acetylglucosamine--N-acetylmuramyl-(pentapeptide) pyrophosphoryl-undecaprenol N-acetylglucosamine transferase, partial [Patescibacteria group bacterium]